MFYKVILDTQFCGTREVFVAKTGGSPEEFDSLTQEAHYAAADLEDSYTSRYDYDECDQDTEESQGYAAVITITESEYLKMLDQGYTSFGD